MSHHKRCVVLGCFTTDQKVRSFPLAKDKERFLKWLEACGNSELLKLSEKQLRCKVVCDRHFEDRVKLATTLSRVAVPTLFLPKPIDASVYKFNDVEKIDTSRLKQKIINEDSTDDITRILVELSESDVGGSEDEVSEEERDFDAQQKYDAEQDIRFSSEDSDLSDAPAIDDPIYIGRDNITVWEKNPCASSKFIGISPQDTRPIFVASGITDELSAFREIIDNEMLEEIVTCTNCTIDHKRSFHQCSKYKGVTKETSKSELLALIGLLYLVGMKRASYTNLLELWADDGTGLEICRSAMSYRRFLFLLDCLRFDNRDTRIRRLKLDKLAPIRNIWNKFVKNCKTSYVPSESLVVGDRLKDFRGKCSFIQHIPKKPARLKITSLVDAKTSFTCNMELYCGKQPEGPFRVSDDPTEIVHRLIKHIKDSKSNVTCDNNYADYSLAVSLLEDQITFLGAMRKVHREIPLCFLPKKSRPVDSSRFGFRDNVTLVSYVPENNKAVIVLSTMHHDARINPRTLKPVIVEDYNANKDAVDIVEQTCATYSVSKKTKRWPLAVFFALLDVAGVNAQILYNSSQIKTLQKYRRGFLKNLGLALLKPQLKERAKLKTLTFSIWPTTGCRDCIGCEDDKQRLSKKRRHEIEKNEDSSIKKGVCFFCRRCRIPNTSLQCDSCSKFMCKEHIACTKYVCLLCHPTRCVNKTYKDHR